MSVSKPTNRTEFAEHILAKLGKPVIKINVTDDQVQIAIEEAFNWFHEWHYAGSKIVYYIVEPSPTDIENRRIILPENITAVTDVYSMRNDTFISSFGDLMGGGWDMMMNLGYASSTSGSPLISFVATSQHYQLINQIITGQTALHFNQFDRELSIDAPWDTLGQAFAIEAYSKIDPEANPTVYQDRWLVRYATAKVKETWGNNLSKYSGMQLPGGIQFNGKEIQAEAVAEIKDIEDSYAEYSMPPRDHIG